MNVLILTTHANTGGITSYILTLGSGLVQQGHKVFVVSSGGDCAGLIEKAGMRHLCMDIRTKSEASPKLWLKLPQLKSIVIDEKIDVIHAQTRVTQVLGTVLGHLSGVPLVTTCHGFFRPRWFRRNFPCWGQAVIAISKPVACHLKDDFKLAEDKIHLIQNGIDLSRFKMVDPQMRTNLRKQWTMEDCPLIGIIARLSDVKGIDVLINAMPVVINHLPSAKLMIVGQGPEEARLKMLVKDKVLGEHVLFKNTINRTDEILPAFDVFVMPSLMEGLGLSVMEAQASGVPVVATRVGGLVDLIEDGKSGYLVDKNDPQALAQAIIKILDHPEQAQTMAAAARANTESHFSAGMMVQRTISVYEQHSRR